MFDKIAIANNAIVIARYVITYAEKDINGGEPRKRGVWALSEKEKNEYVARLQKTNAIFTVNEIEIPKDIEKYDRMHWTLGRDAALKMINGDPTHRIAELKEMLVGYDKKVLQHERCHRMGIPCKHNIEELDRQAEAWVAEINKLEEIL